MPLSPFAKRGKKQYNKSPAAECLRGTFALSVMGEYGMSSKFSAPDKILVSGARVHNLKNVSVDIPLGEIVGMAAASYAAAAPQR